VHDQLDELPPVEDAELALFRHLVDGPQEGGREASR